MKVSARMPRMAKLPERAISTPSSGWQSRKEVWIALVAIFLHLLLRYLWETGAFAYNVPLYEALSFGGAPLIIDLVRRAAAGQFGSDLLAGISIVTSIVLQEYLAGTLVVLMLSGGGALES